MRSGSTNLKRICVTLASTLFLFALAQTALSVFARITQPKGDPNQSQPRHPALMLWVWDHPADLRFIDTTKTGAAILTGKIFLTGERVRLFPRLNGVLLAKSTYTIAVVRIEVDHNNHPALAKKQIDECIKGILQFLCSDPVQSLQIDFDAQKDEREFYRLLVSDLRSRMPSGMPLSVTSLASWCLRDDWIANMPVDEVVPMFFSMGRDRGRVITLLGTAGGLAKMPMNESIGLSIDEPDVVAAVKYPTPGIYLFSTYGWNSHSAISQVKAFQRRGPG